MMTKLDLKVIEPKAGLRVGDYQLISLVGRGSSGDVWRAASGKGQVAIKFMSQELLAREDFVVYFRQFRQEVRALDMMSDHPRTPSVLGGQVGTRPPYFVMSLVAGQSFSDDIASGKMMTRPVKSRLQRLFAVAATIDSAHRRGILHRDIKPGNIRGWNVPFVLDFSISVMQKDAAEADPTLGTTLYMPPFEDVAVNRAWDLYGFALVCYEVIFGRHALFSQEDLSGDIHATAREKLATGTWHRAGLIAEANLPVFMQGVDLEALDALFQEAFTDTDQFENARSFVMSLARLIVADGNLDYVDQTPDLTPILQEHALTFEDFTQNEVKLLLEQTGVTPKVTDAKQRGMSLVMMVAGFGFAIVMLILTGRMLL